MGRVAKAITHAVRAGPERPYAIAKGAGIDRSRLSQLLSGERGLSSESIERLADYLGLRITIEPKTKPRKER